MNRKSRNIISLLLLFVFILPTIVKLEHHHEQFVYKANNEKNIRVFSEKCVICNFEFFVFLSDFADIDLHNEKPLINYSNNYSFLFHSDLLQFSYLLRAPPALQI
jgi:hypothetical protein